MLVKKVVETWTEFKGGNTYYFDSSNYTYTGSQLNDSRFSYHVSNIEFDSNLYKIIRNDLTDVKFITFYSQTIYFRYSDMSSYQYVDLSVHEPIVFHFDLQVLTMANSFLDDSVSQYFNDCFYYYVEQPPFLSGYLSLYGDYLGIGASFLVGLIGLFLGFKLLFKRG